ncbi:MAG: hypothetical protein ACO1SV_14415 [Fimbriimonas sp.]
MEAIRIETTIAEDGVVHVPELKVGEHVEVIVLRIPSTEPRNRQGGWAKDRIKIHPGFDDPIPGMEDYV